MLYGWLLTFYNLIDDRFLQHYKFRVQIVNNIAHLLTHLTENLNLNTLRYGATVR